MRCTFVAFLLVPVLASAADPPLLLQRPAVSAKRVVFSYAGDLWIVGRDGGDARRLTAGAGRRGCTAGTGWRRYSVRA